MLPVRKFVHLGLGLFPISDHLSIVYSRTIRKEFEGGGTALSF